MAYHAPSRCGLRCTTDRGARRVVRHSVVCEHRIVVGRTIGQTRVHCGDACTIIDFRSIGRISRIPARIAQDLHTVKVGITRVGPTQHNLAVARRRRQSGHLAGSCRIGACRIGRIDAVDIVRLTR